VRLVRFRLHEYLRSSLWFIPSAFVLLAFALWLVVGAIDRAVDGNDLLLAYGGGPDGAQEVLSAIATSMIAFTGVVFSITIVVLQLASGQFSPRVLRTFLRDRATQSSLGIFIATFVYALLVLRDVRAASPEQSAYVPGLSVSMALVVLALSLGVFVYYIHHIAQAIRVSWIIDAVADETRRSITHQFTDAPDEGLELATPSGAPAQVLVARVPGVVQAVGKRALVALARRNDCVLVMRPSVGDFVPQGGPLLHVHGERPLSGDDADEALDEFALGLERTMEQDPAFGFRQIVDIAVRGLSPAINDPTTAVQCLDHLHDLLRDLAVRPFRSGHLGDQHGELRLVVPPPSWDDYLDLALDEIRHYGATSVQVARRIRAVLDDLETVVAGEEAGAVRRQRAVLDRTVEAIFTDPHDRALAGRPDAQGLGSTITG
jgi:uncharacterized membrane protein